MTFGMILDRSFNLYVRNFGLLFGIMALSQVVNQVNYIVFNEALAGTAGIPAVLYTPLYLLVNFLTMAVGGGAVTIAVSSRYLDREITILQSYRIAFSKIWTLLGAKFVAGLLVGLGLFLLFVPGVLLAVAFTLITPVIMLEDCSVANSRERSRELTKGFRWQILALFLLYYAGYYLAASVIGGLFAAVTGALFGIFPFQPYINQLLVAPLLILPSPIPALFTVLIYYNQRIKKEGFDLALLAEALARE